jgi:uncharacterized protein (DUF305 family)
VSDDEQQVVSDAQLSRMLQIIAGVLGGAVLAVACVLVGRWVIGSTEEAPTLNAVDVGFLQDMIDHHLQAIEISEVYLAHNGDGGAASFAREVAFAQEFEIGWMDEWLVEGGARRGADNRMSMLWMGMSMPVSEMPGMQSDAQLAALGAARGDDADRLFFSMMTDHHRGAVEMADAAARNGSHDEVVEFATSMSRNQRLEIDEYRLAVQRLGL